MKPDFSHVQVQDLQVQYELADYTAPWKKEPSETFLLHHGYARNMLFWQQWMPLLSRRYQVLRFDARGCGGTTRPPERVEFTLEQFADDAIRLMDTLKLNRVHWVGESSGGIIGLVVALRHPDRLHSLTVCDTPFKRPANIASTYMLGETDRAAAIEKYGVGGWCRRTLSYRLDTGKASEELCDWYCAQMDRTPKYIANALERMIGKGDLWPMLPKITVPTLILSGEKSPIAQADQMQAMRQQMPAANLVAFAGYGHGINLLAPERCVEEVVKFVNAGKAD